MSNIMNVYKDLPPWAKGVTVVATLGVAFIVGRTIYVKIDEAIKRGKLNAESRDAGTVLTGLANQGIHPTLNSAQLEGFCNSIVQACGGCGTDEDAIYNVMSQMGNDADVYALIKQFATRKYDGCNWDFDFGDVTNTLAGAISDELGADEKSHLNEILRGNGITYQFT